MIAIVELLVASLILGYWSVGMVLLTSPPKSYSPKEYPIPSPPPAPIEDRVGSPLPDPITDQIYASMIAGDSQLRMNQMVQDLERQEQLIQASSIIGIASPLSKTQKRKKEKKEFEAIALKNYKEWLAKKSPNAMADLEGTNTNEDLDIERIR